jgi:hypothetical protein
MIIYVKKVISYLININEAATSEIIAMLERMVAPIPLTGVNRQTAVIMKSAAYMKRSFLSVNLGVYFIIPP